ncbi:MAG: hypothetical protein J1E80_06550 [Desulfovibrionaceae bacterium]|nr:hypothetical protein [Desulfovibrionaceae bacterium]
MTVAEAKKILSEWVRGSITEEFPLVWVSELQEEDENEYRFKASIYAPGENPEDEAAPHAVNKHTGKVEMRILLFG